MRLNDCNFEKHRLTGYLAPCKYRRAMDSAGSGRTLHVRIYSVRQPECRRGTIPAGLVTCGNMPTPKRRLTCGNVPRQFPAFLGGSRPRVSPLCHARVPASARDADRTGSSRASTSRRGWTPSLRSALQCRPSECADLWCSSQVGWHGGRNPMSANFCANCGTEMRGAKFCPDCGTAARGPQRDAPSPSAGTQTAAPPRTNGLAIASMVLGILWIYFVGSLLALILGYRARRQIDESNGAETGRGFATAQRASSLGGLDLLSVSQPSSSSPSRPWARMRRTCSQRLDRSSTNLSAPTPVSQTAAAGASSG